MGIFFARLLQFAAGLGMIALTSLGVNFENKIPLPDISPKGTEIASVLPPPTSFGGLSQKAATIICGDKTFVPEFLACGEEIGRSVENRPIYVFEVGPWSAHGRLMPARLGRGRLPAGRQGPFYMLFIGGLHTGTEKNTFDLASKVLQYFYGRPERVPEGITLYIIPKANPDGIAHNTHNNARGVDLNRNWLTADWRSDPYHPTYGQREGAGGNAPLSEPETKALFNYIAAIQPNLIFTWHSQAGTVDGNGVDIADEAANVYAQASGYKYIEEWTYYETTGTFLDAMRDAGIAAIDVELASRKTEFSQNIKGVNALLDFTFPQF